MIRTSLTLAAALLLAACATKDVARVMKGDPPPLAGSLEGGPWLVEDLNGGGVMDNALIDLNFDPGDQGTSRVAGRAACNRYSGSWTQTGTTVRFGPLITTKMACAPALMDMEQKFLSTLEAVTTLSFDGTGAALLKSPDGRIIKIRRER
ncbi:META domain-containing protein [Polymorphobacter sp.]|uniref:META domain-containing protein n=1 Tax=Polymorphobacter sp. TaxID=1909290 RepID=UPI003F6FA917